MTRLAGSELARFHAGDAACFRRLVDLHSARLMAVAYSFTRDVDDAHDLVQETWHRAFEKRASYSGSGTISGWLYAICRNVCRSRVTRLHRAPPHDVAAGGAAATPAEEAERAELRRRLYESIGDLPPRERDVLVLRLVEGRSTRETAAILGCAEGTVKSALHHAVKKLQSAMEVWTL